MANICEFKVRVKGNKFNCYALYGGQGNYDKEIIEEFGTDEDYTLFFEGSCKWDIDCYCSEDYNKEVNVPTTSIEDAFEYGQDEFWTITIGTVACLLDLDLEVSWADVDDYCGMYYEHNDVCIDTFENPEDYEKVPEEFKIKPFWIEDEEYRNSDEDEILI